jgi:hypothetical protein
MSRRRRVGIVGIANPPSTAGTRGKTNLSRMARFARKDRRGSDSFSQSSRKSQAPRLCPKDVHDHPAWTPELGFPPASKWRYTWMLRPKAPGAFFSSNACWMGSGRSWTIVEDLGCSNPSNRSQTIVRRLSSLSTTMSAKLTFEQRLVLLIRPSRLLNWVPKGHRCCCRN